MLSAPSIVRPADGDVLNVLGVAIRFLASSEDTSRTFALMENLVPFGAGPPLHTHAWEEAFYVIEGEIDFQIEDRTERARAGDFLHVPSDAPHGFHGASGTPARMLVFFAPGHGEDFFKEVDREVCELPRDLPKVLQIGAKHGFKFMPKAHQAA